MTQSMQRIVRLVHTNLFSKRDLLSLFGKSKRDKKIPSQLTLSLRGISEAAVTLTPLAILLLVFQV